MTKVYFNLKRVTLTLMSCILLTACGGSGGDDGIPISTTTPSTGAESSIFSLKIDQDNAGVVGYGASYAEAIVQFGDSVATHVIDYARSMDRENLRCDNQNAPDQTVSLSLLHEDQNRDFFISPEDTAEIHYINCQDRILEDVVTGVAKVSIRNLIVNASNHILLEAEVITEGFQIDSVQNGQSALMSARFLLRLELTDDEILTISSGDDGFFRVTNAGQTERATAFQVAKTTMYQPNISEVPNELQYTITFDSDLLDGTFECADNYISSRTNFPIQSTLECQGDSSVVKVINGNASLDDDGDGSFETLGEVDWFEVFEGYVYSDSARLGRNEMYAEALRIGKLAVEAKQLKEDSLNDRVLIFTSETDSQYPSALLAFDRQSRTISILHDFSLQSVNQIVFSHDASQYCPMSNDDNMFSCYNTQDNSLLSSVELDYSFNEGDDFNQQPTRICSAVAANQHAGTYVVVVRREGYVCSNSVMIENGMQLPSTSRHVPNNTSSVYVSKDSELTFTPDDSAVLFFNRLATISLTSMSVNSNGYEKREAIVSKHDAHQLEVFDGLLVDRRGLYDPYNHTKLGEYTSVGSGGFTEHVLARYFDRANNRVYFLEQDKLVAYQADTFVRLAEFSLELKSDTTITGMLALQDNLLVFTDKRALVIPKSELAVQAAFDLNCEIVGEPSPVFVSSADCQFTDLLYDDESQILYGTTPGIFGTQGNSVVIFDMATQAKIAQVYVGSEPTEMILSGDKNTLFVRFEEMDKVVALNLTTMQVSDAFVLLPSEPNRVSNTYKVDWILGNILDFASSPFSARQLIIGLDESFSSVNSIDRFFLLNDNLIQGSYVENVFAEKLKFTGRNTLIGMSFYASLETFQIIDNNIEKVSEQSFLRNGSYISSYMSDNIVLAGDGKIVDITGNLFDPVEGLVVDFFDVPLRYSGLVLLDEANQYTYFINHNLSLVEGFAVSRHDSVTGQWLANFVEEDYSGASRGGHQGSGFLTNDGLLGATNTSGKLFILDVSSNTIN